MEKLSNLIPADSLNLVNYSGTDLIDRLGKDIISNVVLSVLCGDNIRNLTEGLTQRRILLMNASLFVTYLKALSSYKNLSQNLSEIVTSEVRGKLSPEKKRYLLWFLGLTGKSVQNVIREKTQFERYISNLNKNLSEISTDIEEQYGGLEITATNEGIDYLLQWPDLLRCMLAIGAQTLTIRGSEKSMYGKLFEKFVLGSTLTILGFDYISRDNSRNTNIFWLSERLDKRESDATALLKPGAGIRFDIGFIGAGNTEVSLDKVSRFERVMERNGYKSNTITIILIDKIGDGGRIETMAKAIGGYIIQMSGTYWVHELAQTIKKAFPFYKNPLLSMSKEQSLEYLRKEMSNIDLSQFLTAPFDSVQIAAEPEAPYNSPD